LHLTKQAAGTDNGGEPSPDVVDDFDGAPRGPKPDVGADER